MKRIAIAVIVTAASLAAASARADTRVHIGVSVGAPAYHSAPRTVVVAPPPAIVVATPRGYWKEVQVRTWVPERWVVRHSRWGRPERYCEPGHYAYTTQRVWVETPAPVYRHPHHHHGYRDHHGRYDRHDRHDHHRGWRR